MTTWQLLRLQGAHGLGTYLAGTAAIGVVSYFNAVVGPTAVFRPLPWVIVFFVALLTPRHQPHLAVQYGGARRRMWRAELLLATLLALGATAGMLGGVAAAGAMRVLATKAAAFGLANLVVTLAVAWLRSVHFRWWAIGTCGLLAGMVMAETVPHREATALGRAMTALWALPAAQWSSAGLALLATLALGLGWLIIRAYRRYELQPNDWLR